MLTILRNFLYNNKLIDNLFRIILRGSTILNPKDISSHRNLGHIYYFQGHYDEAITSYQRAIALMNPELAALHHSLGNIYHAQGNYDEAIFAYQRAIELNPQLTNTYYRLGSAYLSKGHYRKAINFFGSGTKVSDG